MIYIYIWDACIVELEMHDVITHDKINLLYIYLCLIVPIALLFHKLYLLGLVAHFVYSVSIQIKGKQQWVVSLVTPDVGRCIMCTESPRVENSGECFVIFLAGHGRTIVLM